MLKILELFGGIGACSKALERLGIDYEIADYVEIDKYAVKSFNAIHNTNFEPQDICKWDKDIEVDLIMHGSPCQDFSLAGKQAGGDKNSGTRSSLMYETIRIVEKLKPKYVIWENVKNLLSKKHIHNFNAYLETMKQLGYTNYYQVLNAKDYGIPQNRERVFTVSILGDESFEFPEKQELKLKLKDMLEENVDEKYYLSDKQLNYVLDMKDVALKSGRDINDRIVNPQIAKTISCRGAVDQRADVTNFTIDNFDREIKVKDIKEYTNFYIIPRGSDSKLINGSYNRVCKTDKYVGALNLTKITEIGDIAQEKLKIRKLTPKECWRLMGFDDEDFEKASKVNSNTQLYKQAGNSIVVNVLEAIFKELIK